MFLPKEKIKYFKKILEKRKKDLEGALKHVAQKNPRAPGDWEVTPAEMNVMLSDKSELADTFEELESRTVIEDKLEERLIFTNKALEKIKKGTYGICETCGKPIDEQRLQAFPCAKNCIKHAKNYK